MPQVSYELPVNAQLQTVWEILLTRIERPDQFMSGVESVDFPENEPGYAMREVVTGGMPLREKITIDEALGQVRYELMDHPLFEGDVYNRLIPPDGNDDKAHPMVAFAMNWRPKTDEARQIEEQFKGELEEGLRQGVLFVKQLAEERDENEPADTEQKQEIIER